MISTVMVHQQHIFSKFPIAYVLFGIETIEHLCSLAFWIKRGDKPPRRYLKKAKFRWYLTITYDINEMNERVITWYRA